MRKHEYRDEAGNLLMTRYPTRPPEKCPACESPRLKDMGSWHKCFECGESIETAVTTLTGSAR